MVYVFSKEFLRGYRARKIMTFDDKNFPASGEGSLAVPDRLRSGRYQVQFWNTFTGEIFQEEVVVISDQQREVTLPSHRVDLAIKLIRMPDAFSDEGKDARTSSPHQNTLNKLDDS